MLIVENISAGYKGKQVLDHVSFEIQKGEIALLIGPNGAGKSTVLKSVFGLTTITKGTNGKIAFENQNIVNLSQKDLIKRGIIYAPQKNNLFSELTVLENLKTGGSMIRSREKLQQRIDYTLSTFPQLKKVLHRTPFNLSGGEKQLLVLAMTVLHDPKLIMLDEPSLGLSPKNLRIVLEEIKRLNETHRISFIIVEHKVAQCLPFSHKIIGMRLGKIVNIFNNTTNLTSHDLKHIFL